MNYETVCFWLIIVIFLLSVALLSPNIVWFMHKKWFAWKYNFNQITRLEIINHKSVDRQHNVGRILVHSNVKSCELELQDNCKTLKIFI